MKDFYSQLSLASDSDEAAIRQALPSLAPDVRSDAEMILLNPHRRMIYDRNHRLLTTIGELRMHLGLNYTRFWSRQEYREFRRELAPAAATAPRGRRVDAMLIVGAFQSVGRHGRRHATRKGNWVIALILVAIVVLVTLLWRFLR